MIADLFSYFGIPLWLYLAWKTSGLPSNSKTSGRHLAPSIPHFHQSFLLFFRIQMHFILVEALFIWVHYFNETVATPNFFARDLALASLDNMVFAASISILLIIPLLFMRVFSWGESGGGNKLKLGERIGQRYCQGVGTGLSVFYFGAFSYLNHIGDHVNLFALKALFHSGRELLPSLADMSLQMPTLFLLPAFILTFMQAVLFQLEPGGRRLPWRYSVWRTRGVYLVQIGLAILIYRSWLSIYNNNSSKVPILHTWRMNPFFSLHQELKNDDGLQYKMPPPEQIKRYIEIVQHAFTQRKEISRFDATYPFVTNPIVKRGGAITPGASAEQIASVAKFESPNIILILLESFMPYSLPHPDNGLPITPYFDSLKKQGIFFSKHFANGTHSSRAYSSVLCSILPVVGAGIVIQQYYKNLQCLPDIFSAAGYDNAIIYGGRFSFDNMDRFFIRHHVQELIEGDDFAIAKTAPGVWGILDESLFMEAVRWLRARQKPTPFLLTLITLTNHSPYNVPEDKYRRFGDATYLAKFKNTHYYTDQMLKLFFEQLHGDSQLKATLENTVFILVSDHGQDFFSHETPLPINLGGKMEDRSSLIPLLLYAPGRLKPKDVSILASQIDIAPTLLGLMGNKMSTSFMGVDLLDSGRAGNNIVYQYNDNKRMVRLKTRDDTCFYQYDPAARREKILNFGVNLPCKLHAEALFYALNSLVLQDKIWPPKKK